MAGIVNITRILNCCILLLGLSLSVASLAADVITFTSPDGKMSVSVNTDTVQLSYDIKYQGRPVIDQSSLGLSVNGQNIGENVLVSGIEKYQKSESYPWRGNHSQVNYTCNGRRITLTGNDGLPVLTLDIRAYDNGVAWCYVVAGDGDRIVNSDNTTFNIPAGSTVYMQPDNRYYEGVYSCTKIEEVASGQVAAPPVTVKLPEVLGYAAITEGGLTDFAGWSLQSAGSNLFRSLLDGEAKLNGTITSPWRIVSFGTDLNTLVNCDIVSSVSPAYDPQLFPYGFDTSWIKPGRCTWSWLAESGPVSLANMKDFSKAAGELGFEYNLVDDGWDAWREEGRDKWDMLKELVGYADSCGVKTWVWKAYHSIKDQKPRREFFAKCKSLGVVGLKIDFMNSESQEIIRFYQSTLADAADYELMIDFHGSNKPTGETRRWPNEMTREGVRGLENRAPWAQLNTIHPFVRYLAGHGDYTPLNFGQRKGDTTTCHQIASVITYTSPFMCLGVNPHELIKHPAREFVCSIPTVWDETVVLPGSEPGKLSAFARRNGQDWFVAVMNGPLGNDIAIDMSFLKAGSYNAAIITDNQEAEFQINQSEKDMKASDTYTAKLKAGGGLVIRLTH